MSTKAGRSGLGGEAVSGRAALAGGPWNFGVDGSLSLEKRKQKKSARKEVQVLEGSSGHMHSAGLRPQSDSQSLKDDRAWEI